MIVGIPREIKADEYRVAVLPVGARLLAEDGHTVLVEKDAGRGSGFDDDAYIAAGAQHARRQDRQPGRCRSLSRSDARITRITL